MTPLSSYNPTPDRYTSDTHIWNTSDTHAIHIWQCHMSVGWVSDGFCKGVGWSDSFLEGCRMGVGHLFATCCKCWSFIWLYRTIGHPTIRHPSKIAPHPSKNRPTPIWQCRTCVGRALDVCRTGVGWLFGLAVRQSRTFIWFDLILVSSVLPPFFWNIIGGNRIWSSLSRIG